MNSATGQQFFENECKRAVEKFTPALEVPHGGRVCGPRLIGFISARPSTDIGPLTVGCLVKLICLLLRASPDCSISTSRQSKWLPCIRNQHLQVACISLVARNCFQQSATCLFLQALSDHGMLGAGALQQSAVSRASRVQRAQVQIW